MNAELEYAANTFGLPNPEYDTMGVSDLQKQLNIVNDEISDIQKKIQNKQAEIEAIKSGTNLTDLDKVAREEYIRTGSSAPMQSLENSRLSKEMTAKTQADIDEETLDDTLKQIQIVEADLVNMYKKGGALTSEEQRDFLKSYAEYERLGKKLKKVGGTQYNDNNGNGIDDSFEDMKSTIDNSKTISDSAKVTTKINPVDLNTVAEFASQYKNYDVDELKKAKETIVIRLGDSAKGNDLNLDNSKVAAYKDALEAAGFKVYSFKQRSKSNADKNTEDLTKGAINAAYDAWDKNVYYSDTAFSQFESNMKDALEKYNTEKKSNIKWDSIKEAVKSKIKSLIGDIK